MIRSLVILSAALLATTAIAADDLSGAILAEDGWVSLTYPARDGVHGGNCSVTIDGRSVVIHDADNDGLVHLSLLVRDKAVAEIRFRIDGPIRKHEREARDLGATTAATAAAFLLDIGRHDPDDELAATAVAASSLADTETWPELAAIARDRRRGAEVREAAIFWLSMAAGDKVERELTAIIDDDSEEIEIREHAVFALHQALEDDPPRAVASLGRIATENPHPQVRRNALFWLAQHDDPAVVDLFERILLD